MHLRQHFEESAQLAQALLKDDGFHLAMAEGQIC